MQTGYSLHLRTPETEEYLHLRIAAGLTARSRTAAEAGLPQTVVAVVAVFDGLAVGMGRVIGDGLFYQVVDLAVEPGHQGRGIGKAIMSELMRQLSEFAPAEAYVSLIADGRANELYTQFGFTPTAPASIGMARWLGR